jgi:hypothetical protein
MGPCFRRDDTECTAASCEHSSDLRFHFSNSHAMYSRSYAISPRNPREFCSNLPPSSSEGAGNAGRSMHPQPRVRNEKKHTSVVTTVTPETPGIPRAMVLRLIPRSPRGPGFFAPVASRILPRNLTPASGCQDHTTLPSADTRPRQKRRPRPLHPAPNVRDDRETPLRERRDDSIYRCFYQAVKRNFGKSEI